MMGIRPTQHMGTMALPPDWEPRIEPAEMQPGVTFLVSVFDGRLTARLYGMDGSLLHEWPVDFFELARENATHKAAHKFHALIHGAALLPNGDMLANLDGRGTYRISACGDIVWKNDNRSHHALTLDDSGGFWTPVYVDRYAPNTLVRGGEGFNFDAIARFDLETGEQTDLIDLVKVLTDDRLEGLMAIRPVREDVGHLNDVEVLSAEIADAFPEFNAGDLLLSFRHFNQIWVLDGESHKLKWYMTGPMIGQHDPDFQADGTITVFDNRAGGRPTTENAFLGDRGGSRVLKIDPMSRTVTTVFGGSGEEPFYSHFRGKHQVLANGNILLAETDAGRAFEVTPDGKVVWEVINSYGDDTVFWMMDALRYPLSYGDFVEVGCT
ncbi:arylsulfotransferase family protein [Ruegeria lacuscaerulensis]|uniref:arylsulfotransferase family protein n=1 Tax=Ruegeria lacuscaerulensis TaxID=55218 RepID=UPI0014810ED2|nr:arylsulfotransferase family protein [Ruegeria lacuscaerulensis]